MLPSNCALPLSDERRRGWKNISFSVPWKLESSFTARIGSWSSRNAERSTA